MSRVSPSARPRPRSPATWRERVTEIAVDFGGRAAIPRAVFCRGRAFRRTRRSGRSPRCSNAPTILASTRCGSPRAATAPTGSPPRRSQEWATAARSKAWLGYSDTGYLLAGLYRAGIGRPAHGPMPVDMRRDGGEAAVRRALRWLRGDSLGLEPVARRAPSGGVQPDDAGNAVRHRADARPVRPRGHGRGSGRASLRGRTGCSFT